MTKILCFFIALLSIIVSNAQIRDTLKLKIEKVYIKPADTVFLFSSHTDTIALQPLKTDTSKIVKDVNPQDLEETKYKIKLFGQIRVNGYYDFSGMTSTEGFIPYDIPVGEQKIEGLTSAYIGARQSRFGMEGTANTKVGRLRTYLEVDFASATDSYWRLRHAYVEWGFVKMGYTWTTFMDNASLPNTVDFEGPNSAISKRQGLVRYEKIIGDKHIVGASIETPHSDYYNPADSLIENKKKQGEYDLAARYKRTTKWGHIQVAALYRRISYLHIDKMNQLPGMGFLFSSIYNINERSTLYGQFSIGQGISYYYVGFSGKQLDAVHNPNKDDMELKKIIGSYVTYNNKLSEKMTLSGTVGLSYFQNYDFEPDDYFWSSQYLAITYFYNPIETISLGAEFTTGTRSNLDRQKGNASRISLIGNYNF